MALTVSDSNLRLLLHGIGARDDASRLPSGEHEKHVKLASKEHAVVPEGRKAEHLQSEMPTEL